MRIKLATVLICAFGLFVNKQIVGGADVSRFKWAAEAADLKKFKKQLKEQGVKSQAVLKGFGFMHYAVKVKRNEKLNKRKDFIKYLLKQGASINEKDLSEDTPLHVLAQTEDFYGDLQKKILSLIKFLVKNKADVNAKNKYGDSPLYFALKAKNFDIAKFLIQKRAIIDDKALKITKDNKMKKYLEKEMKKQKARKK